MKLVDQVALLEHLETPLLVPTTDASLILDITDLPPTEAAARIVEHAQSVTSIRDSNVDSS